jgi:Spy/CpxP family protein refolding chaperone
MKVSPYVVAAALLLSGAGATLRAEPGEDSKQDGKQRWSHEGHEGHGPRGRMKETLGLSDEQEGKLKALRRATRDASAELGGKLKASLRRLHDQLEDKASDKELAATLEAVSAARKALSAERERFETGMAAILTPTQRARLLESRLARMHGRGGGMMKRGER